MEDFWAWHTRTWMSHGAFNTTQHIGLGWGIGWFAIIAILLALSVKK